MVSFISFTAPGRGKGGTRGAVTLQAPSRSGAGQGCSWAGLGLLMACRGREGGAIWVPGGLQDPKKWGAERRVLLK